MHLYSDEESKSRKKREQRVGFLSVVGFFPFFLALHGLTLTLFFISHFRVARNRKANTSIESTKTKLKKMKRRATKKKEGSRHVTKTVMKEKKRKKARTTKEKRRRNGVVNIIVQRMKRAMRRE